MVKGSESFRSKELYIDVKIDISITDEGNIFLFDK